jgi:hypothetical protein
MVADVGGSMRWWPKFGLVLACVFGIVAALVAGFLWLDYNKSAEAVPRVRAAADQFVPGDGWTLTKDHFKGPAAYCVAVRCPGIQRIWERDDAPTAQDAIRMITASGYLLNFSDCLDVSVDERLPGGNGVTSYGCQTTPAGDLRTQVYVSISQDWNAAPDSGAPPYVYTLVLLVSRVSSTD